MDSQNMQIKEERIKANAIEGLGLREETMIVVVV
jgi:hypothetical protein